MSLFDTPRDCVAVGTSLSSAGITSEGDEFPGDNTERDDQEVDQEDSWEEESGTEIILEEACEPEEESYAEERPWCDYSDREAEQDSFGTNSENEEEDISEAGRNVKDSQLVLAEEEEVESEAGRNVTEPEAHSTYFSGYGQREETYPKWEDEMETLFQSHHVPEEEKVSYATKTLVGSALAWWQREQHAQWYYDDPDHTWESFKLEILEEFVKKDPDQPSRCPAHTIYALSNPKIFKAGSEQVNHHHSPQKMEPAVEKKTAKRELCFLCKHQKQQLKSGRFNWSVAATSRVRGNFIYADLTEILYRRDTADSGFIGGIEKWTEHCRLTGMNPRRGRDGVEFGSMGKLVVEVRKK
ncbi:hypothetical protein Bca4012_036629 [Brassica carinata]